MQLQFKPLDGSSTYMSTPSLSTKSNTPTTPQDPHGSFSALPPGTKTPEDDPSVWINPILKSSTRFMPPRSEYTANEMNYAERPRGFRSSFDMPDTDFHRANQAAFQGGLFGTGLNSDDFTQMSSTRGRVNRDYSPSGTAPLTTYPYSNWLDSKDSEGLASPRDTFGGEPRAQNDAPIYPFNSSSPYSSFPN